MQLSRGQKIPIKENFLTIKFERPASKLDIDTSAFLTQANGKVAGDEDLVFYNNPRHNSGSVTYKNDSSIDVDLTKVPRNVEKISLTATIYDAEKRRQNFSMIRGAVLKIFGGQNEIATFPLENFTVENAIVLGEVYRYKGTWKFNATGAGFSGGLKALCKNFGIDVEDTQQSTKEERKDTRRQETPPSSPPPPPKPPKKVELRKGQKVSLIKKGKTLGEIVINLNWSQPQKKSNGFFENIFSSGNKGIDLDLACLFELKDGTIGAVQALGNLFGDLNRPPYMALDGDDRTGAVAAGETIRVNGKFTDKIRRILIYTFIYQGAANWEEAKGVVTVNCPGSPELIVRMDEYGSRKHTCAIALLENEGDTFSVEKIVEFFDDSEQMDKAFDWGLRWTVGRKD